MIVAVVAVLVVQAAADQVIVVAAVGDARVAAARTVDVTLRRGRAPGVVMVVIVIVPVIVPVVVARMTSVVAVAVQLVDLVAAAALVLQLTVVQVIDVVAVADGDVAAARAVDVAVLVGDAVVVPFQGFAGQPRHRQQHGRGQRLRGADRQFPQERRDVSREPGQADR